MNWIKILGVVALILLACSSATVFSRVFPESISPANSDAIPVTAAEEFIGCGGTEVPMTNPQFEQAIVEQTNQLRMEAGLPPLKRVEDLNEAARYHAADMSNNDYFSHDTFDRNGRQLIEVCDTWNRIQVFYTNWDALAENIAAGQRTPESAMEGWINSPDHYHNLMSDSYREIGVGFYEGKGEYRYYWVQDFGRTTGRYPLIIDGERSITTTRQVPVYIFGEWDEVRLRNNQGEWSEWMAFTNNLDWVLPEDPGLHTVTAELRGPDGETVTSDTIELIR